MHSESVAPWQKPHAGPSARDQHNARKTTGVLILTVVMMAAEITAGTVFHSMALLADGWHMASHAAALGIAAFAFFYARRHAENSHYSFGTGKVNDLAGFSSALLLLVIAALMVFESVQRLIAPESIAFNEALVVAAVGLVVNLVSAWMLRDDHHHHGHDHGHAHGQEHTHDHGHKHDHSRDHGHDHGHARDHDHDHNHDHDHDHAHAPKPARGHGDDHNMRAAYVHVLTDAITSVLAIAALVAGLLWNITWLDAAMGIVGAIIIAQWSWSLIAATSRILLDAAPADGTALAVRKAIESENDNRIADLHVWRLSPGHLAAVVTVVTHQPRTPGHYKDLLARIPSLSHVTIEVERCCDEHPHAA